MPRFSPELERAGSKVRGIVDEFRIFIQRGNVIDLAVGVIMGTAFGKIVSSLVADVLMPPIGLLIGGINFSALRIVIGGDPEAPVAIYYGRFLQTVLDFVIIAGCVFAVVKAANALSAPETPTPKPASPEERLLTDIRDLLREQSRPKPS